MEHLRIAEFWDSSGLGVGLGTARTSSFPIAVLSNVGVPGALFFLLFTLSALVRVPGPARTFESDVRLASRNGCLCLLVGACVAGPTVDLGLHFFILAGLASCNPAQARLPAPLLSLRGGSGKPADLENALGRGHRQPVHGQPAQATTPWPPQPIEQDTDMPGA